MEKTLKETINSSRNFTPEVIQRFLTRFEENNFTRDEEPKTHFCVYFFPYDKATKKVFMVHHKKANLWLSPGGHIDRGETPIQALEREIKEELGVIYEAEADTAPFLLTMTPIDNTIQPCKMHYDIWYLFQTDGSNFKVDPAEFHETKWLTIPEAEKIITEPANLQALNLLK